MKTFNQLKEEQDKLNQEPLKCPKCGEEMNWGWYQEWGNCGDCVEKYMREKETNKL